jgi:ATP-dependent exoDNAse (exonuclease V) alpha subunit
LAYAVTIHKSQGMTLNKAVVHLGEKDFTRGLTFVAISQVRKLKDIAFLSRL